VHELTLWPAVSPVVHKAAIDRTSALGRSRKCVKNTPPDREVVRDGTRQPHDDYAASSLPPSVPVTLAPDLMRFLISARPSIP
jgi:hypothetical protein